MEYLNEYSFEIHEEKGNYNVYRWYDESEEQELPKDPRARLPSVSVSDEVFE